MAESSIQEFYKNQTIFLTGGTGFLGKQVLSKLLISCNGLKKVYLLIREKKDKSAEERLSSIFESFYFDSLKKQFPNFRSKIGIVKGDCELPQLGISHEEREFLENEVTCIIHVSATVRFDENLKIAAYSNVRAVQDLVKIAKNVENLKSFVYVSTAYSNCNQSYIKEEFYPPPMSYKELFDIVNSTDDNNLEAMNENVLGEWPNTYTFTKAIAENVIREEGKGLPIAIVRPAIVLGPVKEPEPGYFDAIQGISALSIGVYLGIVRTLLMSVKKRTFIVPSDYVANNILAAGWYLYRENPQKIPIYNFTESKKNPIIWESYTTSALSSGRDIPTMVAMWWPFTIITDNKFLFEIYHFLLHMVPAYFVDLGLIVLGKKTKAVRLYKKIGKSWNLVGPFTLNTWTFENSNVDKLWENMNEKDKNIFCFNMDDLDWSGYIRILSEVVRVRILNDPLDTLPKAKTRQFVLRIVHYLAVLLMLYLYYNIFYAILKVFYSSYNAFSTSIYNQKFDIN